jgi:hypothetical protein
MATAAAYTSLSDAQLRDRLSAVLAMPDSAARTAELEVIRAEVSRRGSSSAFSPSGGLDVAARIQAQAGGYATSAAQGVRDVFSGALDEFHAQQEQAATWLRWGTVAFGLLVLLLVFAIGAWFFAPARALIGAAA